MTGKRQLTIRDVPDDVVLKLRIAAARKDTSLADLIRHILAEAAQSSDKATV